MMNRQNSLEKLDKTRNRVYTLHIRQFDSPRELELFYIFHESLHNVMNDCKGVFTVGNDVLFSLFLSMSIFFPAERLF